MSINGVKKTHSEAATGPKNSSAAEQLHTMIQLLESVVENRDLLAVLSVEERTRLLHAAGQVYAPDLDDRRRRVKARVRRHKEQKLERIDRVLNETGIRKLRSKKVFTTPNVYPPEGFT